MSAVGTALGPSLGGVLIAGLGWQAIFLVKLPLGLLALLLAWRHLPADRRTAGARPARNVFDPLGTLLLALTLAAYALAVTLGRGSFGALNAGLLLAAALGIGLFVAIEARVESPLIRLAMFREPRLAAGVATSALVSTVVMGTLVVGPFYLSHALGLSAAMVGLVLSAGPLVSALTGVPAGRLVDHLGAQRVAVGGLTAMLLGCLAMTAMPPSFGIAGYVLPVVVVTGGYALFQAANNTAVMADLVPDRRGLVSGLLNLARNLGLITGASAMAAVFAFATGNGDISAARPEALAHGMHVSFAMAASLAGLALLILGWSRRAGTCWPASASPR
jgi:MFS family permease